MPGLHEDEEEEDECRICRDIAQPDAPLITPCACRGSLAFVHSRCLFHWLKVSHGAALHGRPLCTVCQQPFRFRAPGLASYIIERPSWRPHGLAQWLGRTAARFCRHLLHDASCGHVECLAMRWAIALAALQLSLWEGQMILILSWGFIRDALSLDRALDEMLVPPQLQPLLRSIMPSPLEVSEFAIGFPDGHSDPTQRATSRSAAAAAATRASCVATPTGFGAHPFVGPDSALHTGSSYAFWVQLLMPASSTEAAAHVQAAVLGMGAIRSGGSRAHGAGAGMPPGQPGRLGHRPWTSAWSAMCRLGARWADASHSALRALLPVTFGRPASSQTAHPSPAHSTPPNDPRSDISPWVFGELDGALQSAGRALYSLLLEPFSIAAAMRLVPLWEVDADAIFLCLVMLQAKLWLCGTVTGAPVWRLSSLAPLLQPPLPTSADGLRTGAVSIVSCGYLGRLLVAWFGLLPLPALPIRMHTPLANALALHALLALFVSGGLSAVGSIGRILAEDFAVWRWQRLDQSGIGRWAG